MKKILLPIYLFVLLTVPYLSFAKPATEQTVKKYLVESGYYEVEERTKNKQIMALKYSGIPDNKIAALKKEMMNYNITDGYIPIYQKYYTEEEMQELIQFRMSTVGKIFNKFNMADKATTIPIYSNEWLNENIADLSALRIEKEKEEFNRYKESAVKKKMDSLNDIILQEMADVAEQRMAVFTPIMKKILLE